MIIDRDWETDSTTKELFEIIYEALRTYEKTETDEIKFFPTVNDSGYQTIAIKYGGRRFRLCLKEVL